MRILVQNNGYLAAAPSGGDRHLLDISEVLSAQHAVTFIIPEFAVPLVTPKIRCQTYHSWRPQSVWGIMGAYLQRCAIAIWIAWREPADVVLASAGPVDILPALIHRRRFGSCVVVYPFHLITERSTVSWMQRFQFSVARLAQRFALYLMRQADVVFTDNQIVAAELATHGISKDRIHVQRPVVNIEAVQTAPPVQKFQVLFIGRMVRSKGIYDLVDALKEEPVQAGLVGDGEELVRLRDYIKQNNLGNRIHVLGPLPSTEMYSLLKGCDLFVFPSHEEGYGIAIAEAIAANRPVLAYDLPHYREVFNNSLLTVPMGDRKALALRLHDFFARRIDVAAIREKYRGVALVNKTAAAEFEFAIIHTAIRSRQ